MIFTSMLPNASRMIPANPKSVTGKSGWQISKFWHPSIHTEKNVIESFKSRLEKNIKGKEEIEKLKTKTRYQVYNRTSEDMPFIESSSVDYIFTDPPYGESIAYLGLSMFWNSWLKAKVDYKSEIIYDPYRKKGYDDYSQRISNTYKEMSRVLKPGRYLSFTFHNRNLKFWKIIIEACINAGFALQNVTWQPQAVSSGTQGINKKNTLRGDFIYNFQKTDAKNSPPTLPTDSKSILFRAVEKLFDKYNFMETHKLYEKIIPIIVKKHAFIDKNGNVLNIDELMAENYKYVGLIIDGKMIYGWKKK